MFSLVANAVSWLLNTKETPKGNRISSVDSDSVTQGWTNEETEIFTDLKDAPFLKQAKPKFKTQQKSGTVTHLFDGHGLINSNIYFTTSELTGDEKMLKVGDQVEIEALQESKNGGWKATEVNLKSRNWDFPDRAEEIDLKDLQSKATVGQITSYNGGKGCINQDIVFTHSDCAEGFIPMKGDWVSATVDTREESTDGADDDEWSEVQTFVISLASNVQPLRTSEATGTISAVLTDHGYVDNKTYFHSSACAFGYKPRKGHVVKVFSLESTQGKCQWRAFRIVPMSRNSEAFRMKDASQMKSSSENPWVIPGQRPKFAKQQSLFSFKLPQFRIPDDLHYGVMNQEEVTDIAPQLVKELSFMTYKYTMSALLHLEEIQKHIDIEEFAMTRVCLHPLGEFLALTVPGLAEGRPSVLIGDQVILSSPVESHGPQYEGFVHEITSCELYLKFTPEFHARYNGEDYNVEFTFSRVPLRRCHQAISLAVQHLGSQVLFVSQVTLKDPQLEKAKGSLCTNANRSESTRERNNQPNRSKKDHDEDVSHSSQLAHHNKIVKKLKIPKTNFQQVPSQAATNGVNKKQNTPPVHPCETDETQANQNSRIAIVRYSCQSSLSTSSSKAANSQIPDKNIPQNVDVNRSYETPAGGDIANEHTHNCQEIDNAFSQSKIASTTSATGSKQDVCCDGIHVGSCDSNPLCYKTMSYCNKSLNTQQKVAVHKILLGQSRPTPYVIFGPPGTGKTITVVEAILQVFSQVPSSRILACTPSNSAADLILERLHHSGLVKQTDLVRLNAMQRGLVDMPEYLLKYCRFADDLHIVVRHRIIVCTCNMAGSLYGMGLSAGHITNIFIDECGQATEPECMIPISLISGFDGQIVLAGDPKQLGPVIRSPLAKMYGLEISFLERLMDRRAYCRKSDMGASTDGFDSNLVTMLVNNYRSHPSILALPSRLFYYDQLQAHASQDLVGSLANWPLLPRQGYPVVFHGVRAEDVREQNSPSWFNAGEVVQIAKYYQGLLNEGVDPKNIGIITPYRKQVEKIRMMLERLNMPEVKVGSVEEFQGQERHAILISTVRSNERLIRFDVRHCLGFLSNPKRFNVSITRAQALLVIVGNPHVLALDPNWCAFIQQCVQEGGYTGCQLPDFDKEDHPSANETDSHQSAEKS